MVDPVTGLTKRELKDAKELKTCEGDLKDAIAEVAWLQDQLTHLLVNHTKFYQRGLVENPDGSGKTKLTKAEVSRWKIAFSDSLYELQRDIALAQRHAVFCRRLYDEKKRQMVEATKGLKLKRTR